MATAPSNLVATPITPYEIDLSWTNPSQYYAIDVMRKPAGGAYSTIQTIGGSQTNYQDYSCQDGSQYYYKLYCHAEAPTWDGYSNEANAITPLGPPTGLSATAHPTTADLTWVDNSQNESAFRIYKATKEDLSDASLLYTTGPNVTAYTATGLTAATNYWFYVVAYSALAGESDKSNILPVFTSDPPTAPSNLTAQSTSTTTATLNWKDNSDNELNFRLERSSTGPSSGFAEVAGSPIGANITTYADTDLVSNTQYWYRVRAYNTSAYSDYSNVATIVTQAAIAAPTELTVTPISNTVIEIKFRDNSTLEDSHVIDRKVAAGAWVVGYATLAPNQTFYRDTGLSGATLYTYRVYAMQGATPSGYSDPGGVNGVGATTLSVPPDPSGLAITEYQDTWVRINWTPTTTETGYRIEQNYDGGGYAEIAVIGAGLGTFKATGLSAGHTYGYKVRAYNAAGNSGYTGPVTQLTRSQYLPSKFEILLRKSKPNLVYLAEANPLMELASWSLSAGQTYTYEAAFSETGATIDHIYQDGAALTQKSSIATVEATAGTWWQDRYAKKVYVHTTTGNNPVNNFLAGSFWLYFTTWQKGATYYNDNLYLPFVTADGIPDISQELQPYYEGNFVITTGTVALLNAKVKGAFYFDKIAYKYFWLNRKVKILAGGESFAYTDFVTINTGIINSKAITDQRFTLDLRDYRDGLHRDLPTARYSIDTFPNLDTNAVDKQRSFSYGTITNFVPVCIDTINRVFEFQYGRIKSVTNIYQNGVALVGGTDYFIDYANGQITLARGLAYDTADIITVDFHGAVNSADEEITNGTEIFKHLMNNFLGVTDANLNLDEIYVTKYVMTTALGLAMYKGENSQDIIRKIEHSMRAYSGQDSQGRLTLRAALTAAPSDIKYIPESFILELAADQNQDSLFSEVNIWHSESMKDDKYLRCNAPNGQMPWKYGVTRTLDIYTALTSAADAKALSTAIIPMLGDTAIVQAPMPKGPYTFTVPRVLFNALPGDLVYASRNRFYSLSGVASNLLLRILSITKSPSSGKTTIKAEVV